MAFFLSKNKFSFFRLAITATIATAGTPGWAAQIQGPAANWRLQNYVPGGAINLFFTGSSCTYGALTMPASASEDEKNRFWSTIVTAKATNTQVGVYYDDSNNNCFIQSFYLPP